MQPTWACVCQTARRAFARMRTLDAGRMSRPRFGYGCINGRSAHIVPDAEPQGEPRVRNGLSLCRLHHAAFDRHFLGVRPDYVIEVREDILEEHDGPTLVHAIQALHGSRIILPERAGLRPAVDLLELRYDRFRHAPRIQMQ